jgi:hypothetical protein
MLYFLIQWVLFIPKCAPVFVFMIYDTLTYHTFLNKIEKNSKKLWR